MRRILIATSNAGKLRDFAGAAAAHGIEIAGIPDFSSLPRVVEDGLTFEANARKKAEEYSRYVPGEIVVADDSGLEVDALNGAPGVHSARYAAPELHGQKPHEADDNTDDEANNARVLARTEERSAGKADGTVRLRAGRGARREDARHVSRDGRRMIWTLRAARTGSDMIRCFIFRRFKKHLPNSARKRRRGTAIGARRFGSFWSG